MQLWMLDLGTNSKVCSLQLEKKYQETAHKSSSPEDHVPHASKQRPVGRRVAYEQPGDEWSVKDGKGTKEAVWSVWVSHCSSLFGFISALRATKIRKLAQRCFKFQIRNLAVPLMLNYDELCWGLWYVMIMIIYDPYRFVPSAHCIHGIRPLFVLRRTAAPTHHHWSNGSWVTSSAKVQEFMQSGLQAPRL